MCGTKFKKPRTKEIDYHKVICKDSLIAKRPLKARLLEWFLNLPGRKITKFIAWYLIYAVFIHHFKIQWTIMEAALLGIGLGLAID